MNQRVIRVEELMKREVSAILCRDMDFDDALATISRVSMTPDLRQCHVYISVVVPKYKDSSRIFNDEKNLESGNNLNIKRIVKSLNKNKHKIVSKLLERVSLKNTPRFTFREDYNAQNRERIVDILESLPNYEYLEAEQADEEEEEFSEDYAGDIVEFESDEKDGGGA